MPMPMTMTEHLTSAQTLEAIDFPLWGSRLIEASAGTGKTWTIAALYLRLVLGHGSADTRFKQALMPADILVMTFTRAATRELSDRIRARLLEAARCFRNEAKPRADDVFLHQLLGHYSDHVERQQAAWRLAMAAECMDEASVHTIDAWCQRMLREHAFDSGSLFEEELVADEQALLIQAVQDYWRKQCYGLSTEALQPVLRVWPTVDALLVDVKGLLGKVPEDPHCMAESLASALQRAGCALREKLDEFRAPWPERVGVMRGFVQSQDPPKKHGWDGRQFSVKTINGWLDKLQAWAQGRDDATVPELATGWTRLTLDGLSQARTDGARDGVLACMNPAEVEAFEAFSTLRSTLQQWPTAGAAARRHAALSVAQRLHQLKRQQGSFGFSDLQERLNAALQGPCGAALQERIAAQYPVALIDEFQDTSPVQYGIFEQIYKTAQHVPERALLLIGDPKQSIYGFRGADIYSYLQARQATEGRHYVLSVNYRSTHALVKAVNHGFLQAETRQGHGALQLREESGQNPLPFVDVVAHGRPEKWVNAQGDMTAITLVHDLQLRSAAQVRQGFAERCAEQIATWLNDPDNGFAKPHAPFQRLRPQDIAILVRTGKEAAAVQRALQKRHVASVYLSDKDSVYQSDEARDLLHWLRAVAAPQDSGLVRAALALGSVGLPLAELVHLASDDEAFDAQVEQLRGLRQTWQSQGVLAMLRQTLHRMGLAAKWLAQSVGGERSLTNYLHLAELLQNASVALEGEQALIRWLMQQMADSAVQSEEHVVRLESDADLVKIVTIHASKGLEYPVVCMPFATSFRGFDARLVKFAYLPVPQGGRQLVLDIDDAAKVRHEQERLREDLRLLYVALTRPRHGLWLGFSALKVGTSKVCKTHWSALGCLLGGDQEREAQAWLQPLQQWASSCDGIALVPATDQTPVTHFQGRGPWPALQAAPDYLADFDRSWSVLSYSRLTRDLKKDRPSERPSPPLSPLLVMRPADDEAPMAPGAGQGPAPAATMEVVTPLLDAALPIWHRFKRGPVTGNWLHQQLDWLSAQGFALAQDPGLSHRLQVRCEREHASAGAALTGWLTDVVQHRLPGLGVSLSQLQTVRSEMAFWLPARHMETVAIDALCCQHLLPGVPRARLHASSLHGMLMGFMDLVFEWEGRYWVLDYKSNALGHDDSAYDSDHLHAAMVEHRYDVQAAVYTLALHRLLRSRLGQAYDPLQHLGGAVYFFIRGIHGPAGGTCTLTVPPACLAALEAMLDPAPDLGPWV